jgi:hypothetical protein
VLSPIAGCLRLASILLCLVVTVSFALFAISQTSNASAHQQRELNGEVSPPEEAARSGEGAAQTTAPAGQAAKGSARRRIDEVAEAVTSPFSGVADGAGSEWLKRGLLLTLTLAVYGFGLGFLARTIRVRL